MALSKGDVQEAFTSALKKHELPKCDKFRKSNDNTVNRTRVVEWFLNLEYLFPKYSITDSNEMMQMACILGGEEFQRIDMSIADKADDGDAYQRFKKKMLRQFGAEKHKQISLTEFYKRSRKPNENVTDFHLDLLKISGFCEFGNQQDNQILIRMSLGINDEKMVEAFHKDDPKTAAEYLTICQAIERAREFARMQDSTAAPKVQRLFSRQNQKHGHRSSNQCGHCGKQPSHSRTDCPAQGKKCHKCQRLGHFGSVCRSSQSSHSSQSNHKPKFANKTHKYQQNRRGNFKNKRSYTRQVTTNDDIDPNADKTEDPEDAQLSAWCSSLQI